MLPTTVPERHVLFFEQCAAVAPVGEQAATAAMKGKVMVARIAFGQKRRALYQMRKPTRVYPPEGSGLMMMRGEG